MKKLQITPLLFALLWLVSLSACSDDDDNNNNGGAKANLTLNITGLEDLGDNYIYEGWLIVNEVPVSTDTFSVNSDGALSKTSFEVSSENLSSAVAFVLTIEPNPDTDPAPSDVHILGGNFSGSSASLSVGHLAALNNDFSSAAGSYILATPTDGDNAANEESGVWFLNLTDPPTASLTLPTLPDRGWTYEGWVVINGTPVSTGKFTSASGEDEAAPHSRIAPAPPFPGEDLLVNAPSGLTFPTDLSGATIVISVEPDPDNSPAPFVLKPLAAAAPNPATPKQSYTMRNSASATNPSGTASRPASE